MEALVARTGQHIRITNPWHAVEIRSSRNACPACKALAGARFLSTEAPRLPVAGCLQSLTCNSVYVHHDDRRAGPRRGGEQGLPRASAAPTGRSERRIGRGRRAGDASS
jgi:hypothetical protein